MKCGTADRSWQSQLRERPTLYQALLSLPRYVKVHVFFVLGVFVAVKVEQPFFFGVDESYGHDDPVDERKAQHTYVVPHEGNYCEGDPPAAVHWFSYPGIDSLGLKFVLCN